MMRYQAFPSAATSTLMKNQNQYPPTQTIRAPICQRPVTKAGAVVAEVG